eukprot:scpid101186/ scgid23072/ 
MVMMSPGHGNDFIRHEELMTPVEGIPAMTISRTTKALARNMCTGTQCGYQIGPTLHHCTPGLCGTGVRHTNRAAVLSIDTGMVLPCPLARCVHELPVQCTHGAHMD